MSVKSGNVTVRDIQDLRGTPNDKKDVGSVFVTRQPATRPMREFVNTSGVVQLELLPAFPKLQILTPEVSLERQAASAPLRLCRVTRRMCFMRFIATLALILLLAACAAPDRTLRETVPPNELSTQELEDRIRAAADQVQDLKHRLQRSITVSGGTPMQQGWESLGAGLGKAILRQRLEQARTRLQADISELRKRRSQAFIHSEAAYLEAIRAQVDPDVYPLFELAVLQGIPLERRANFVRSILQFQRE